MPAKTILIQNYHPAGTAALIRDFCRLGFTVYSPDSNWGRITYFGDNAGLGGNLISMRDYMALDPGYLLLTCKPQEEDLKAIAREHGDTIILNIAQQHQFYEPDISDVMICPDIATFEEYPSRVEHKLLYFPRPILNESFPKDVNAAFASKIVCSYISIPHVWPRGYPTYLAFKDAYPHQTYLFGHESPDGLLGHVACNARMASSYFTVHFKDHEAYGLSCLESMLLGTPIVSLRSFMQDKTLGRYFLNEKNSIVVDTLEQAVNRLLSLSLDEYCTMSANARQRVLDQTADDRTIDRLRRALRL